MNFFAAGSAAERYARGRTRFHPLVVRRVKELLSITTPLRRALDAACGTGLSTVALREAAARVIGADASAEMLARAERAPGVSYVRSPAERLPFRTSAFDIVTVCQALHWFERERFFAEAHRVLRAGGRLVVYDNYFAGATADETSGGEGVASFRHWFHESYLARFPAPPRRWVSLTDEETRPHGFRLLAHEELRNAETLTAEALVDYLLTQTNVIAAVEGAGREVAEVRGWMDAGLRPVFGGERAKEFPFVAPVWVLRREGV